MATQTLHGLAVICMATGAKNREPGTWLCSWLHQAIVRELQVAGVPGEHRVLRNVTASSCPQSLQPGG